MNANELADLVTDELPSVEVLRVQPGDEIVFTFKQHLSAEQFDEIQGGLQGRWPDNPVMIIDGGGKVRVVRKDEA